MAGSQVQKSPARAAVRPVSFQVKAPGAREVLLTGEFTGWATDRIRLTQTSPGEWVAKLDLAPGEYQYRLLVDGEWRDNPDARKRVPNPYGGQNCVLTVS